MDVGDPEQVLEFGLLKSGIVRQHRDQGPHFAHQIFQLQAEVKTPLKVFFNVIDVMFKQNPLHLTSWTF